MNFWREHDKIEILIRKKGMYDSILKAHNKRYGKAFLARIEPHLPKPVDEDEPEWDENDLWSDR